jgi:hypothetical protein
MSKIESTLVQAGSSRKPPSGPQGSVSAHTVNFDPHFEKPPVVVVTPFWNRKTAVPLPPETVVEVTSSYFVTKSVNGADDFFINWIAVPQP